jgi:hypothetical protein
VNGSPTSGVSSSSMNLKNWLTIRLDRSVDLFSLRGTEDYRKELTRSEVKRRCKLPIQNHQPCNDISNTVPHPSSDWCFPGSSFPGLWSEVSCIALLPIICSVTLFNLRIFCKAIQFP